MLRSVLPVLRRLPFSPTTIRTLPIYYNLNRSFCFQSSQEPNNYEDEFNNEKNENEQEENIEEENQEEENIDQYFKELDKIPEPHFKESEIIRIRKAKETSKLAFASLKAQDFEKASYEFETSIALLTEYLSIALRKEQRENIIEEQSRKYLLTPYTGLSYCNLCLGKFDHAVIGFEKVLEWVKNLPGHGGHHARTLLYLAEIACIKEDKAKAIELTTQAVDLIKNNVHLASILPFALSNLATYLFVTDNQEAPLQLVREAIEKLVVLYGKNNPITESCLEVYFRFLNETNQSSKIDEFKKEWDIGRFESELNEPDHSDPLLLQAIDSVSAKFPIITKKKTFDPTGFVAPPELIEAQKKQFLSKLKSSPIKQRRQFEKLVAKELENKEVLVNVPFVEEAPVVYDINALTKF